ncbi:MAG: hypothetical protein M1415_04430 [Firmicutes bacterium]|nr:hypothetical protein [Bacillota bacterium]
MTVLLTYGLVLFVFQDALRLNASHAMTGPLLATMLRTLRTVLPDIDSTPCGHSHTIR